MMMDGMGFLAICRTVHYETTAMEKDIVPSRRSVFVKLATQGRIVIYVHLIIEISMESVFSAQFATMAGLVTAKLSATAQKIIQGSNVKHAGKGHAVSNTTVYFMIYLNNNVYASSCLVRATLDFFASLCPISLKLYHPIPLIWEAWAYK